MSHKHKNLSLVTFSLLLKKFIKNINGFFGMKPSSKSQALLQVYVHEGTFVYHTKMLGNAISFEKLWVLFTRTVWTEDFVLQDEVVNFPFAKKHSK